MGFFSFSRGHTFGILDADREQVPGTVRLHDAATEQDVDQLQLERKRTPGGTILEPQPDDSPNDPLNWPTWRRDCILATIGWHCLIGGGQTPILAAGFADVSTTFGVTIPQVALTTGLYMLGLGIGCVISSPTALIYGKRPVYLAGTAIFLASSIWAAASQSYTSLLVARILMGVGVSPCESLPAASISEIYFHHERAYRIGIYTLLLLSGKNLIPLVGAAVIQAYGWRWVFWIVSIIVAVNLVLLFFLVPDTFWDRTPWPKNTLDRTTSTIDGTIEKPESSIYSTQSGGPKEGPEDAVHRAASASPSVPSQDANFTEKTDTPTGKINLLEVEKAGAADGYGERPVSVAVGEHSSISDPESQNMMPNSFKSGFSLYGERQQNVGWWKAAFRPFVLFAYPAVLWSALVYSLSIGWLIVISESMAEVYQHNPYNFSRLGTGLIYISPFIGGLMGTAVAGKLSDFLVNLMCKRNGGIFEPEFRLVMAIPVAISTAIGLMGFGWSADEQDSWIVPTIFFGIISFGCSLGSTTSITFCVDSYREYAGEALVTLNFSKNVFHGFVFSLFINRWLQKDGHKTVFIALGAIQMACLMFTIPMYIYGKRLRRWTQVVNMMERF